MSTRDEVTIQAVTIRFPLSVLEGVRAVAKQHDRSLNGEVIAALREHIKRSQKDKHKHAKRETAHTTQEAQTSQEPESAV
jgi:hypothetical protein